MLNQADNKNIHKYLDQALGYFNSLSLGICEAAPIVFTMKIFFDADISPLSTNAISIYAGTSILVILKVANYAYKANNPGTDPTAYPNWVKLTDALFNGMAGFTGVQVSVLLVNFMHDNKLTDIIRFYATGTAVAIGGLNALNTTYKNGLLGTTGSSIRSLFNGITIFCCRQKPIVNETTGLLNGENDSKLGSPVSTSFV